MAKIKKTKGKDSAMPTSLSELQSTLPQVLQPGQVGASLFDGKGAFWGYEDVHTLTANEIAEQAEIAALKTALANIDNIKNTPELRDTVKLLANRLIRVGVLP